MLASYQTREGVPQALDVLAGSVLDDARREQIIGDTLRGDPDAKRFWPEHSMSADVSAALDGIGLPVNVLIAEHDKVER